MDKPYSFIPLLGKKFYKIGGKLYRGRIKLKITTLTPLYIMRAELWEKSEDKLRKNFYQVDGRYLVPASSLKGAVRTIAQSVSYSCINTRQNEKEIEGKSVSTNRCQCIVCATFGKMLYKSKVFFKDFQLKEESESTYTEHVPKLMHPHPEKSFYKEDGKFKGIKFYYHGTNRIIERGPVPVEAVKPNSCFEGEVLFDGLDIEQLKLLCFSLGLDGSIQLKLGYNKPGYFGSCNVEVIKAEKSVINELYSNEEEFDAKELALNWGLGDIKVLENIEKLRQILCYKNAKKISDWNINNSGQKNY